MTGESGDLGEERIVRLSDLPVDLVVAAHEHFEELLRELQIIAIGVQTSTTTPEPAARLADVVTASLDGLDAARATVGEEARAAADTGDSTVSLELKLAVSVAPSLRRLLDVLDEADGLCEEGELITLAAPVDVRSFRRQVGLDVLRQLES